MSKLKFTNIKHILKESLFTFTVILRKEREPSSDIKNISSKWVGRSGQCVVITKISGGGLAASNYFYSQQAKPSRQSSPGILTSSARWELLLRKVKNKYIIKHWLKFSTCLFPKTPRETRTLACPDLLVNPVGQIQYCPVIARSWHPQSW